VASGPPSSSSAPTKETAVSRRVPVGSCANDATGNNASGVDRSEPLDGSKHNYTLTFPGGRFPPVNAFWSVTMYDGKTQFLIKYPINRYLINSPMLPNMKKNADGSLTIYIQKDSPGKDKESKLASCAQRFDLPGHAPLLSEAGSAFRSISRRGHLEAGGPREGEVNGVAEQAG
jgi:hypothetical protein